MPRHSDLLTIYRVARYYYKLNYNQQQIAVAENISRSQVSRLLEKALQTGIANVELTFPLEVDLSSLSYSLIKVLGLKHAFIANAKPYTVNDTKEITLSIARTAAENLPQLLKDSSNIGVGWGKTVYETSIQLPRIKGAKDYTFFPVIGTSGDDAPELQINIIIDRFCEKFNSKGVYTNISTIRDNSTPLSPMDQERLHNLKHAWNGMDTAIIGLGGPPGKNGSLFSEFSDDFSRVLKQSSSCGDILAQFFSVDGRVFDYENQYILTAFRIADMKKIKNVICLAGGVDKVDAIITAARAGYIKTLITDSITAGMILEKI